MIVPGLAWLLAVGVALGLGRAWLALVSRGEDEADATTFRSLGRRLARRLRRPEREDVGWLLLHALPIAVLLALIPLGAVVGPGDLEITLVAWDADAGLQAMLGVAALVAIGWLFVREGERRGEVALAGLAFGAPLVLCAAGLAGVAGSLRPLELVRQQDQLLWPFGIPLPAWGLFVQPLGCALFVATLAALPSVGRREWVGGRERVGGREWVGGRERVGGRESVDGRESRRLAEALWAPALAMLTTTLFLGGFTLPFSSAPAVASLFAPFLGTLTASVAVAALQVLCFAAKTALVLLVFGLARASFPGPAAWGSPATALSVALPLGLLNLFAAAFVASRLGAGAP
ncbi:MAG: NADH-quinone oxidoreductase subunit H [Myxococcota bacterium]|nr:NADH-quinone oxidoreductase subunit H [Myxococcota bacterium]